MLLVSPLAISSRSGSGYLLTLCVRHDAYEHMPTLNDKINEAAHDTGYFAGATKEKVRHSFLRLARSSPNLYTTLRRH